MGFFIIWLNIWLINDLTEVQNWVKHDIFFMMGFFNEYFLQTKIIFRPRATGKYNEF